MKITLEKLKKWNACEDGISLFISQPETDAKRLIEKLNDMNLSYWAHWLILRCLSKKNLIKYAKCGLKWRCPIWENSCINEEEKRKALDILNENNKLLNYGLTLLK